MYRILYYLHIYLLLFVCFVATNTTLYKNLKKGQKIISAGNFTLEKKDLLE